MLKVWFFWKHFIELKINIVFLGSSAKKFYFLRIKEYTFLKAEWILTHKAGFVVAVSGENKNRTSGSLNKKQPGL